MGGGKGGDQKQSIYNPQTFRPLEGALASNIFSSLAQANPAFKDILQNSSFKEGFQNIGVDTDNIEKYSLPQTKINYDSLISMVNNGGGSYVPNDTSSGTQYKNTVRPMAARGQTVSPYNVTRSGSSGGATQDNTKWAPESAYQYSTPSAGYTFSTPGSSAQFTKPGSAYQFSNPGSAYQFSKPSYTATNFSVKDISGAPQKAYDQVRTQNYEDIARQGKQALGQGIRDMQSRGLGRSGMSGMAATMARQQRESAARSSRDILYNQAMSQLDIDKQLAGMDLQKQGMQADENKYGVGLDQWNQTSQAAENRNQAQMGMQAQQLQAGENQSRDQMLSDVEGRQAAEGLARSQLGMQTQQSQADNLYKQADLYQRMQEAQAGENRERNKILMEGANSEFSKLLQKVGTIGSLTQQKSAQGMAPYNQAMQLYSQNLGIPFAGNSGGGGKGDPFSAILNAGAGIASAGLLGRRS